jgi:hypothetical protein
MAAALVGCHRSAAPPPPPDPAPVKPPPAPTPTPAPSPAGLAFRDAVDAPPPGWTGPVFKLSHDYPRTTPTCDAPWLKRKVNFEDPNPTWSPEWQAYVQDIVDYAWDGQDPDLPDSVGWRASIEGKAIKGNETRWYHIPWMAFDGQRGREFVHGLTNELSTAESTFNGPGRGTGKHHLPGAQARDGVDPLFETWSIGFYNPCGARAVGQGWPASGEPAVETTGGRMLAKGMPFPEGTVVVKILNTTADEHDVPYLAGSTTWQADAHKQLGPTKYTTCDREVRKVHLVQMDLAVVDTRSPTRWVYSTLAYDGTRPGKTVRDRMKPLGVQWGNDHASFPAVPQGQSKPLHETILTQLNLPEHDGCNKRLAGVVDQANSSCVSCHMGAFAAAPGVLETQGTNVPAIFSFDGMCTQFNQANANYFSDYTYPAPFPGSSGAIAAAIPLDSSLQIQVAFAQYAVFKNPQAPRTCPDAGAPSSPPTPNH